MSTPATPISPGEMQLLVSRGRPRAQSWAGRRPGARLAAGCRADRIRSRTIGRWPTTWRLMFRLPPPAAVSGLPLPLRLRRRRRRRRRSAPLSQSQRRKQSPRRKQGRRLQPRPKAKAGAGAKRPVAKPQRVSPLGAGDDGYRPVEPHHCRGRSADRREAALTGGTGEGAARADRGAGSAAQRLPAGDREAGAGGRPRGRAGGDGRQARRRCWGSRWPTRTSTRPPGVRTTAHSRILADNVPKHDAETVRRLHAAGAVMLGKLATHEFAIGGPAFDLPWPPARNPWDMQALHRRVEFRLRRRRGGRAGAGRAGVRHRRLDPPAGGLLRHRRAEADARSGVAPRRDPAGAQPGHRRADGLDRARTAPSCWMRWPATIRPTRRRCRGRQVAYAAAIAAPLQGPAGRRCCGGSTSTTCRPRPRCCR